MLFLALFSGIIGVIGAFILMKLLSFMVFQVEESFLTICLVNKHLYFLPTLRDIVQNLLLIVGMTVISVYFPARRAAKMSVVAALRHVE